MSVAIVALTGISVILVFIIYKVFESSKRKTTTLKFAGQVALAIDEIGLGKDGFVLFHGEHWKAISKVAIAPGQKVKITSQEGLILIVEPMNE